jgi:hypothetical protein
LSDCSPAKDPFVTKVISFRSSSLRAMKGKLFQRAIYLFLYVERDREREREREGGREKEKEKERERQRECERE